MTSREHYWLAILDKKPYLFVGFDDTPDTEFAIEWSYAGEGINGDFVATNSDDYPQFRFTVLVRNPDASYSEPPAKPNPEMYLPVANGSICTCISVDIDLNKLEYFTKKVMIPKIRGVMAESGSIKGTCQKLSWLSDADILKANEGNIIHLTHEKEFYVTGAYVYGVEINGHKLLIVSEIDSDTFCDGNECNERIEKEYGL